MPPARGKAKPKDSSSAADSNLTDVFDVRKVRRLVELMKEDGKEHLLQEAYAKCQEEQNKPLDEIGNHVQSLYNQYSTEKISKKIAQIVTPKGINVKVDVIFQSLKGLHEACPNHIGDWYFSGNYPTEGGNKIVSRAFINFMENNDARSYEC